MSHHSNKSPAETETILRFSLSERLLHWAIALPFLGCLFSALVLVAFYNRNPTGAYRYVFAWMHRGCGAGLLIGPSLVLLLSGRGLRLHFYNVRQAWGWHWDDIKWLALMGLAVISKRIVLPDQGKFNAAEKLNFMMVMTFCPLFIVTGITIWYSDAVGLDPLGPWLIHFGLAATAAPLLFGHMFMATINPDTRVGLSGMISGYVSREWASHHYARWFREHFPHLVEEAAVAPLVAVESAPPDEFDALVDAAWEQVEERADEPPQARFPLETDAAAVSASADAAIAGEDESEDPLAASA